jgi:hypothetical protein
VSTRWRSTSVATSLPYFASAYLTERSRVVDRYDNDPDALCSCYGEDSWTSDESLAGKGSGYPGSYTFKLGADVNSLAVAEPGFTVQVRPGFTNNEGRLTVSPGDKLCVAGAGHNTDVRWACDCFAKKETNVPVNWSEDKGNYVSLLSFGAMFGALSAGQLAEILGRRKTISISSALFVFGTVVCCSSGGSMSVLLIGRVLIGAPIGSLSVSTAQHSTAQHSMPRACASTGPDCQSPHTSSG